MAVSSYDELLSQVNSLKAENSHLKKELQDNSCQLSKLETEASCMKDALTQIHTCMQEEEASAAGAQTAMATSLDQNSNTGFSPLTSPLSPATARSHQLNSPPSMHSSSTSLGPDTPGSPSPMRQLRENCAKMQELEKERVLLLTEQENEEKLRTWYFTQLQSLKQHIDQLPITENYSLQTDMARRQLEYEARQLREVMQQRLGAADDMGDRHDARMQRLCLIEREMQRLQQRRERLEREAQENSGHISSKDSHSSPMHEPNANDTRRSNSPKPSTHHTPETKPKDPKHIFSHPPNGMNPSAVALSGVVSSAESDSPYAHLSADGTVQQIVSSDMQQQQQNNSGPAIPPTMLHGTWPYVGGAMAIHQRHIVKSTTNTTSSSSEQETSSVMSFSSSACSSGPGRRLQPGQLGAKVEMVYSLLSMLGTHDKDDMSRTLLAMSSSQDSCIAMRQSGCLPLLIQLLHGPDKDSLLGDTRGSKEARARAAASLHNIVHSHPEERCRKQEARVLRLLEQIRAYCDSLREAEGEEGSKASPGCAVDTNPGPAMAALMKLSFDEEHRSAICHLGGLHAIADLLQVDYESNGNTTDQYAVTVRRYAGMALTNLTFGDAANKALLCSLKGCMRALVLQLASDSEDLRQVAASVIRNLSWRADLASKKILREVGAVVGLMKCALEVKKESTLKSVLSALWNLSAHFTENKADICAVEGALEFLVATLTYKSPSRTWAVVENGGGILRNISSHVATNEVYRQVLRDHNCLQVLLRHLKSSSLTIVSNACGTLWNLSARNKYDQDLLWELGAVSMLKNLVHSKHKMIAMGSSAALRNLMSARPDLLNTSENHKEGQPTLHVRKQRALEAEIDKNLRETYVSMEKDCHAMQRRIPVRSQHRSPQSSTDYSPVPQRIAIWNPQQSPTHELILNQHRERSHSPTSRQVNPRDALPGQAPHARDQESRKLGGRSSGLDMEQNRAEEGSQHSLGTGSMEGSHKRQAGGSRIAQVMQEVAMHAGIDMSTPQQEQHHYLDQQSQENVEREAPSSVDIQPGDRCESSHHPHHPYNSFGFGGYDTNARRASTDSINSINSDIYPMGTHAKLPYPKQQMDHSHSMDGTLNNALDQQQRHKAMFQRVNHDDMGANMDSTINFSLKYSDESLTPAPRPGPREENYQSKPPLECGHYKPGGGEKHVLEGCSQQSHDNQPQPVVLCQECNTPHMQREGMAVGHAFVPPPQADRMQVNYPSNYPEPPAVQRKLMPINDPCGQDLGGNMDDEKPVDYSRHNLPHSGHLRSRFNEDDHEHYANDQPTDFTQRYNTDLPESSTEGINFVQTPLKTGTTGNIFMNNSEKSEPPVDTLVDNSASKDTSSEGQSDLLRSDSVDTSTSLSSTHTTISRAHDDKTQRYCVEDTPVVFSRCSSLSSLDSNEAEHHLGDQEGNVDQSQPDYENCPKDGDQDEHNGDQSRENSRNQQNEVTPSEPTESGLHTPASLNQIQDTPLIFSRCSSVSSLSSFEVQSICDDHSSCYSDSRRASEVVSPSDLPDSPSQTMPPSPRHHRKQVPTQTSSCDPETVGILPEGEENLVTYATEGTPADFSCATSLSGLTIDDEEKAIVKSKIDDEDAVLGSSDSTSGKELRKETEVESGDISEREQNMLDECINSAMPPKKSTLSAKPSKIRSRNVVSVRSIRSPQQNSKHVSFSQQVCSQEAPNSYATEDTPINFSTATSLSDLSIEDIDIQATKEGKLQVNNPLTSSETSPDGQDAASKQCVKPPGAQVEEMKSESSSLINDAEDSMLEECINSAMPKPRLNKPRSSQLSKHRSPKGLSKLRTPKPSGLPRKRLPSAGVRHKSPSPIPEMGPEYQNASSSQERVQHWQNGFGGTSDSVRTFCTEGTPQQFSTATSLSGLSIDSHSQEDVLNGNVTSQVEDKEHSEMKQQQFGSAASHIDSPRQYAVEGTPMSFSRNDSLSSLSCDDDVDLSKEKKDLKQKEKKQQADGTTPAPKTKSTHPNTFSKLPQPSSKIAQLRKRSEKPATFRSKKNNVEPHPARGKVPSQTVSNTNSPFDSPQVFTLEGTPLSFSRNDSLSSLSCEEDADLQNDKAHLKESQKAKSKVSIQDNKGVGQHSTAASSKLERSRFGRPGLKAGQGHTQNSHKEQPHSAESPVKFAVEDTPVCFSRNSSLSSLSGSDQDEAQNKEESPHTEPSHTSVFAVEDTPICFSRNSSLSSLSVESLDGETSASEQALLDECISSAMPRSRGKKSNRRHRKVDRKQEPGETAGTERHDSGSDDPANELEDAQLSPLSPSEDAMSEFSEIQEDEMPRRGPRITKPGEAGSTSRADMVEKGIRGGRKTYKSPISNSSRSVTVPRGVQPNKTAVPKVGANRGPQNSNLAPKTLTPGGRSGTPNRSGTNTPNRSSTPVRTTTSTKDEGDSKVNTSSKPPPINTDTFTKKKGPTPGSTTPRNNTQQKPAQTAGTATKSLANKQASSKPSAQGATRSGQPSKDTTRSTPVSRPNLSSQRNSPSSTRNTSPSSPASRSPRGSISSPTPRGIGQAAKSNSLSPARSPISSRTSSPSPHTTANTRRPLAGAAKNTTAGRGSGVSPSPSQKSGLPNKSLSPRNSVSGASQKSTSPRNSVSGPGSRNASPRNSIMGTGSKNTSPRSSVSETSARSLSPRNSVSGIPARSISPRNKTPTKAPATKRSSSPAPGDKKASGTGANTKVTKSSNVYRLEVGSQRPTLVKQSTFTKESASLPEQTPENTMGVDSEPEKAIEEADENEGAVENEEVFSPDDKDKDSEEDMEEPPPAPTSSGWRRVSVESESQQSTPEMVQKPSSSGKAGKTPPTARKVPLSSVKPATKLESLDKTSGKTDAAKTTAKTALASASKVKREPPSPKPSWNSSVIAPKNWGSAGKKEGSPNSRPQSPASSSSRSQSPLLSKSRSQSPSVSKGRSSPGVQRAKSQEKQSEEESSRTSPKPTKKARGPSKELDSANKGKSSPGVQRAKSQEKQSEECSRTSPKPATGKGRDLCKELDIPIKNYGGNVTSPVSDSTEDSVWIKRDESARASSHSMHSAPRQHSSTVSLQSQNSYSGSVRSVKSSNSGATSTSSSTSRTASNQKPSSQGAKGTAANKQGRDAAEKKADKKKFSFLKLKMKGKKTEADEANPQMKGNKKQTVVEKSPSEDEVLVLSPESDITSPETDLEVLNLDQQLGQLEVWNSDDNIDNEIMPDEFVEWDSETDIFKEELPDEYLFESGSDVTSSLTSPDSPCKGAYQIEKGNRTDDSPSPEFKQFRLENRLNSFIRMDCAEKECDTDSTRSAPVIGESKNCRSKSVSDAYPVYSSGDQSPPRPHRLRLPKKPFGINRSDSSPTTAIPVLVSPFNYSPSKRSQSEPHSPDTAHRRFQTYHSHSFHESREQRQRLKHFKRQQQAAQEEIVCSSEDSDLISPTLSSRVTTV